MVSFELGFYDYAQSHDVGEPVTSQFTEFTYKSHINQATYQVTRQDTTTGVLRHYEESNRITFRFFE